jgi:phosphate transport system permease protein
MSNVLSRTNGVPDESARPANASEAVAASLKKRYAAEKRFRAYGIAAIVFALLCLATLFTTIIGNGYSAFVQTMVKLDVTLSPEDIDPKGTRDPEVLAGANYLKLVKQAMNEVFPDVTSRQDKRRLYELVSSGATYAVRNKVLADPGLIGKRLQMTVPMSDDMDMFNKGYIKEVTAQTDRRVTDQQIAWFKRLQERGQIETVFNTTLFTAGDSREPELAGIWGAVAGSFFTMLVTLAVSFPLAVASAIYLEEFAPKNRWTQLIEVNINNLAAVPSIVFGLLGLAVFLNFFGLPRSAPLVGGLVLSLITLPTIIIAARAALKAVPPSIREAAYGIGASPVQVVFHHVLPLSMPGILTGTIIGMAQALGETAPLLMIGMVAFVVDIPGSVMDPATVMPVQIYLWSDSPERAFVERTSAAIMVLLGFLVLMNAIAVWLRKKFERRW